MSASNADRSAVTRLLDISPVIPVVVLDEPSDAPARARALLEGGIGIIEVTLRTAGALDAIRRIRDEAPQMCVGAGTVWSARELADAMDAGAQFAVSPGAPPEVISAAAANGCAYLPGAQTATEIAALRDQGFAAVKFFPAEPAGGVAALRALSAVFPGVAFCPTGGIDAKRAPEYLALATVHCVGGSWLASSGMLRARDWQAISRLVAQARAMRAG